MAIPYTQYEEAAAYLRAQWQQAGTALPEVCLVLGSGLGALADAVCGGLTVPYADIPHFPQATVTSHAGVLKGGMLAGKPVAAMVGRFHYYEGYDMDVVCFYVRVMKLLGVKTLVLTNAAGGVNPAFQVGDLMMITDHIKLSAQSPVRGEGTSPFGPRFFDMTTTYTPRLRALALEQAARLEIPLREGVYFFMSGPQFETPAEIRAIRLLGGDAVGMSTVAEAITAAQCGMEVAGFSCITNMAAGMVLDTPLSDEEVVQIADKAGERFAALLTEILRAL